MRLSDTKVAQLVETQGAPIIVIVDESQANDKGMPVEVELSQRESVNLLRAINYFNMEVEFNNGQG